MKRIRRFPRRASDAHLLTPPDTKPFTCVLVTHDTLCHTRNSPLVEALMRDLGFRDHFSSSHIPSTHDVVQSLIRSGHVENIQVESHMADMEQHIHLTRRPKLSKNTLDHLPPLIRQRLRHT